MTDDDDRYEYHTITVRHGDDLDALAKRMEADGFEFVGTLLDPRRLRFRRLITSVEA